MLEKALGKSDFAGEKGPLEQIVKALRQMRASSLEQVDLNTRGKLITTLLRVQRQTKPTPGEPPPETAEGAPAEGAAPSEAAPSTEGTEAAATEATPKAESEGAQPSEAVTEGAETAAAEATPKAEAEGAQPSEAAPAKAPKKPWVDPKVQAYSDVMYLVGSAWRAVGEKERAEPAFAASGRTFDERQAQAAAEAAPRADRPERTDRPERGARGPKGEKGERPPRGDRPERPPRAPRPPRPLVEPELEIREDWQLQARELEEKGRTRDAGRIHERHQSFVPAAKLFELGGDLKSAFRNFVAAKDLDNTKRLLALLKGDEARAIMEKAGAYELLMEIYVAAGDFENVARLYERARQFDQAGLAWERAGKFSPARKAFEKARDTAGVERMRALEVSKLIERGDRLGAAVLLAAANQRDKAVEVLSGLPGPKAFRFLQRAKLTAEADALAERELAKATAENKPQGVARWLEITGKPREAAEAWEKAERKDKAFPLWEQLGDFARAASLAEAAGHRDKAIALYEKAGDTAGAERVKALPPQAPPAAPKEDKAEEGDDVETPAAAPEGSEPPASE